MGLLKNFIQRRKEQENKARDFEQTDKILSDIERKKLNNNERELIGILRREKDQYHKEALRWEEQRRKTDEILRERSMFNNGGFNLLE